MLSPNMAASIAAAINFHLCKHLFTLLCVTVAHDLLYSWFKRMMTAYANGPLDCPGYPGQSAQSDAMLEGSVTSVHPLLILMSRCLPTWRRIAQTDLDIQGSQADNSRIGGHHALEPRMEEGRRNR